MEQVGALDAGGRKGRRKRDPAESMNGGGVFSVDPGGERAQNIDQIATLADTLPTNAMQHHLVIALSE
ncbi:hypothetical protein JTB14_016467 [Gonioctena quinquepunctata]|nr:hypothetical protein JTB14_016467 [Gonioctena quinquepunctata]